MGSAVGSVSGLVGGALGQGIKGITENVIPGANIANQDQLNKTIQQLQQNQQTNQNLGLDQYTGAQQQLGNTQSALDQARGLVQQASNTNNNYGMEALRFLQDAANGNAPSAAQAQLQSGKDQAISTQMAMANSGNLSQMIGGQKTAMDNAANLNQQSANQSAQLRAQEQAVNREQYAGQVNNYQQAEQQVAGLANQLAGVNSGLYGTQSGNAQQYGNLSNNAAQGAASASVGGLGIQQGAQNQAQQQQAQAAGGMLNGMGGAAAAMMMSDEDTKQNIQHDRASRSKGISDFFRSEGKKDEPKEEPKKEESSKGLSSYADDDPRKKAARSIKEGFLSDENSKKGVKKDSMLHAFLDGLDPVTYEYKEPTGEMGKTPGTHMGIIAQDVERAPGGESMVIETPEGKAIDMASAMGMLMSAAADAHDRMSSLEELFKSKKVK